MRLPDWNLFCKRHQPVKNHLVKDASFDGLFFDTSDVEEALVYRLPINSIFTIICATNTNRLYAIPGRHVVDRFGYFIVAKPWTTKTEHRTYKL